jgi:hypothetical protein
VVFD